MLESVDPQAASTLKRMLAAVKDSDMVPLDGEQSVKTLLEHLSYQKAKVSPSFSSSTHPVFKNSGQARRYIKWHR